MKARTAAAALLPLVLLLGSVALSASEPAKKPAEPKPAAEPTSPSADGKSATPGSGMSPEQMMQEYMKLAAPGEHHKRLDTMAGKWKTSITSWMAPGKPPTESAGAMEASWVLGGRFMETHYTGNFMGMPFEGRGLDGYDNVTHQYVSNWIDNMGTMMMSSTGTCDDPCKVLTMKSEGIDPITHQKMTTRGVTTFVDNNTFKMEMFEVLPDGKEMKVMELVANRQQ
ncbi:MAG TPA: DUF1579 domain-containing protein [Thermoanaerobaculia bacterium]|nr:DUF1579 domain-containing protein [Thermoanaerobaculia bacterium]